LYYLSTQASQRTKGLLPDIPAWDIICRILRSLQWHFPELRHSGQADELCVPYGDGLAQALHLLPRTASVL
jgi:hypothetical protein